MSYARGHRWIVRVYGGKYTQTSYLDSLAAVQEAVAVFLASGTRFEVERVNVGSRVAS